MKRWSPCWRIQSTAWGRQGKMSLFLTQLSLTFTGTSQRRIENKWHIILHFYNKFETKHWETLSAPAKLIPIKPSGRVPAVLLPQIAWSITRFMKHSKVKYPININYVVKSTLLPIFSLLSCLRLGWADGK